MTMERLVRKIHCMAEENWKLIDKDGSQDSNSGRVGGEKHNSYKIHK